MQTPITLTNTKKSRTYDLDGLGNWRKSEFIDAGGTTLHTDRRQHNYLNEITSTKLDSASAVAFGYDQNGNLLADGARKYEWDALNRLVRVRKPDDTLLATYTYDALGRRVRKNVVAALQTGVPVQALDLLYGGWRCVEERTDNTTVYRQYVWGIYLDELLQINIGQNINDFGTGAKLYPLQDLLYRTTALCDASGVLREAYDFDAYGNTLIYRNAPGGVGQCT